MREVGALIRLAGSGGKRLPTLAIDTEIGFASVEDPAAFADELTAAVLDLARATTMTTGVRTASSSPPTPDHRSPDDQAPPR